MSCGSVPLKFDAMLPAQPLRRAAEIGRRAAAAGLSGLVVTEAGRTAYLTCGAIADGGRHRRADGDRRRLPAQPHGHRGHGVGAGGGERGPLPPGAGVAGAGAHRAPLRRGVRPPGTAPARVRPRREADLRVLPHRRAAGRRGRVLQPVAAAAHVGAGTDRLCRPAGRRRRRQPVDAPHGRRGGGRCPRAPAQHARPTCARRCCPMWRLAPPAPDAGSRTSRSSCRPSWWSATPETSARCGASGRACRWRSTGRRPTTRSSSSSSTGRT